MGGVAAELMEDNRERWSGDHVVDPGGGAGRAVHEPALRGGGPRASGPGPDDPGRPGRSRGRDMEGEPLLP